MSLYQRKDSTNWWIKLTLRNGRTLYESTGTSEKLRAQEYHDKRKAALWDEERLQIKPARSWREAVVRYLEETSTKATHLEDVRKLNKLHPLLGNLNLHDITQAVLDQVRRSRLREGSKSTCNRYLALIRAILLKARDEWEWVEKVPKVKLFPEPRGRERALTVAEAQRLLQELPEHQRDLVLFALCTGLRQRNVLRLEWSQVDLSRRHAWIHGWQSKNRRPISVPLNALAMAVLMRQVGKHPVRVFTHKGKPIGSANTKAWYAALKRAGIDDFRWHDLRHTWATWQRRAGTPTHELQKLGGWLTGSMVERYAHLSPDELLQAANRLDNLLPAGFASPDQSAPPALLTLAAPAVVSMPCCNAFGYVLVTFEVLACIQIRCKP